MSAAQARKEIKYITSLMRGLMELSGELEEAGSLEKLISEKKQELDRTTARHSEALKLAAGAEKNAADIIANAKNDSTKRGAEAQAALNVATQKDIAASKILEAAKVKAAETENESLRLANEIKAKASIDATAIKASAQSQADSIIANAKKEEEQAAARIHKSDTKAKEIELEIQKSQGKLEALNIEIEKLKSRFS